MKKGVSAVLIVSILFLSISFASAGWLSDAFGGITGYAVKASNNWCNYTDFTMNGVSGSGDLSVLKRNMNHTNATFKMGDTNGDGVVNQKDLDNFNANTLKRGCYGTRKVNLVFQNFTVKSDEPVVLDSCTDSDGGKDYFVNGSTAGSQATFEDKCVTPTTASGGYIAKDGVWYAYNDFNNDSCSGGNCYLSESFCANSTWQDREVVSCSNGCSKGACLAAVEPKCTSNAQCDDVNVCTDDSCVSGTCSSVVNTISCDDKNANTENDKCSFGVCSGTIISIPSTCNDTDGGKDYFVKGETTGYTPSVSGIYTSKDMCLQDGLNNADLQETWCEDNVVKVEKYNCPNGCSNGKCNVPCVTNADCGTDTFTNYCSSDNRACTSRTFNICTNPGTLGSICSGGGSGGCRSPPCSRGCNNLTGKCIESTEPLVGCDVLLDKVKTPQEFKDAYGNVYSNSWNNSYTWNAWINGEERKVTTYSAGWYSNQGNQWLQPYYSVHVFADGIKASEYLDQMMSWGNLCSSEELENTNGEKQVVYKCSYYDKNTDSNNNNNNLVTYWANENVLVEFRGYIGELNSPEAENRMAQNKLLDFVRKLEGDNYGRGISNYLPWNFEMLIRKDLSTCNSELKMTINPQTNEICSSCWQCKIEPAVCPPHGYQQKTCTDSCCDQPKKEESVYCSPGICAGCIIPRWIGGSENICMPYGFRFGKQSSDSDNERLVEGESMEYSLDIVSANSAILIIHYGGVNQSYELLLNQETYIKLPEWDSSISSVSIKVTNIVKAESADEKGYVDAIMTATKTYNAYCDVNGMVNEQKKKQYDGSWESCQNSYECDSNLCSGGECIEIND
ncbi:MAG: hypothetical protein WCP89_01180, partial [archaeon]